jgi:hypothetical protein
MPSDPVDEREVVAVRQAPAGDHEHVTAVKLRDGSVETAETVLARINAHDYHYVMTPVPGMNGYEEHARTGARVLLQAQMCPECGQEVLWA